MLTVRTPPTLHNLRPHLRKFFEGMITKLDRNSHKRTPTMNQVSDIITMMRGEIEEFEQQMLDDPTDENALVELQDAANFAFLAFVALRRDGVKTNDEKLIDEFLRVDVNKGKIYCKKTRAGSQYKVGEEIKGSSRQGYVDIRLQSRASGVSSRAIPRSHIVWWKAKGEWPTQLIDHKNNKRDDDRISNLRDADYTENSLNKKQSRERKLPRHVTQYVPSGRQHLPHYGKFVYQRTHRGVNIRSCYYDTPRSASIKGKRDWEKKVRDNDS